MKSSTPVHWLRAIGGSLVGAGIGYAGFHFLAQNGLYAMMLPGAMIGMVAGRLSGIRSTAIGIACAVIALVASVTIEWDFAPFIKDDSLGYFVSHLHEVIPAHLIMMALGIAAAFWFGRGRD